ncbi:MAG: LLM class flavin-dependent oxidoreductase [Caulobacteraceae bacterium]|nr:LLM class flavin-dependent oxidoreductase [Caulobacteraceae bacterium]
MSGAGELHLALWLLTSGHHIASWRHPRSDPAALTGIDHYVQVARLAERGKLDMVFFEDTLAPRERNGGVFGEVSFNSLDPLIQIAALAAATERIGLAASFSTTYHSPEVLAAKFAAIDRLSGGRAGWNMVTSGAAAGRNFGSGEHPEHAARYANAHEVVHAVRAKWAAGPPSPQGQPVLIQAGMSEWGLDFASSFGEAIFSAFGALEAGRAFRSDLRERAVAKGRSAESIKVLPGFMPIIGSTEREAKAKADEYRALIHPAIVRGMLGERFNIDFTDRPLDAPFPLDEIKATLEDRPNIGGPRARFLADVREGETIAAYAERMTAKPTGHLSKVGSPEQIADFMQDWREGGGCDGFIIQALQIPVEFELFVDEVIPVLQKRGLFRRDYAGTTLRDHLGLDEPV